MPIEIEPFGQLCICDRAKVRSRTGLVLLCRQLRHRSATLAIMMTSSVTNVLLCQHPCTFA
jgi:hypothetical protein